MSTSNGNRLRHASPKNRCPVCGGNSRCSENTNGLILCHRRSGPVEGFRHLGQAAGDAEWGQYIRADQYPPEPGRRRAQPATNGAARAPDLAARAEVLAEGFTPARRRELAVGLGLPEAVLGQLPAIGWMASGPHADEKGKPLGACWTFPERDAGGRVVGFICRYRDGQKKAMPSGHQGLFIPDGWRDRPGPLLVPEGASDVLALTAMGLAAVGRPNDKGGVDHLAGLLRDITPDRPIIVLAETDPKPDGRWPGRDGALSVAPKIEEKLGRPVQWAFPPDGAKDARAWALARKPDAGCLDEWHDLGERFLAGLKLLKAPRPGSAPAFAWGPLDSAAFAAADYRVEWLVQRLLVCGQPVVLGGPRKTMKTSVLADLAVSLASGTPFLSAFTVYRPCRVALLSGESGEWALQETARRVCVARDLDLGDLADRLLWQFRLPQLSNAEQVAELAGGLERDGVEVLIFDPLYLALLAGQGPGGARAENLYEIGPLLFGITRACIDAGATPILAHHAKKGSAGALEPLDLDDLSYAGAAEFARQWLLVSRRARYEAGTGQHRLWLNAGGSCGQGGLWALDVDEGQLADDFTGRKWDVAVTTAAEAVVAEQEQQVQARSEGQARKDKEDDARLLRAVEELTAKFAEGAVYTRARALAKLATDRMVRSVARLVEAGLVEEMPLTIGVGNGAKRTVNGLRRCPGNAPAGAFFEGP